RQPRDPRQRSEDGFGGPCARIHQEHVGWYAGPHRVYLAGGQRRRWRGQPESRPRGDERLEPRTRHRTRREHRDLDHGGAERITKVWTAWLGTARASPPTIIALMPTTCPAASAKGPPE